ncbi:MAG: outer membrane beta-barrel protein [Pseudolabrys sp.]
MARKVRSRLASLTLLEIAVGIAATASVAVPASAQGVPAYSWTGFYVGAHAGYRWGNADFTGRAYSFDPDGPGGISTIDIPARNEGYNLNGGIIGFHGGYNYQFAPNWLAGIEGDWTWGNGSDDRSSLLAVQSGDGTTYRLGDGSEVKLGWQATIRGRLGYVQGPWLFYGTGGVAFIRAKWSDATTLTSTGGTILASAASSASKTLTGYVVGAGFEYMLNRNWIGRVEYLYENFGSFDVPFGFGQTGTLDVGDVQKVRVGISYKFGP